MGPEGPEGGGGGESRTRTEETAPPWPRSSPLGTPCTHLGPSVATMLCSGVSVELASHARAMSCCCGSIFSYQYRVALYIAIQLSVKRQKRHSGMGIAAGLNVGKESISGSIDLGCDDTGSCQYIPAG